MKDTIISGTGNSRSLILPPNFAELYPTWESFRDAAKSGIPMDIGPLNPDGCRQIGDALNKENLLKDSTAALYGLPGEAVVDEVLERIPVGINAGWRLLQNWTTAGTYTWIAPDLFGGQDYEIGVLVIGGGGSGAAATLESISISLSGGASGFSLYFLEKVSPGSTHSVVVGSGGIKAVTATSTSETVPGKNGGSSSFDGKTALGGGGGSYGDSRRVSNQGGVPGITGANGLYGGEVMLLGSQFGEYKGNPLTCFNPFEICMMLGSGGGGNGYAPTGGKNPITLKGGGDGKYAVNKNILAGGDADEPGSGGGASLVYAETKACTATSGAGADGAVKIYVRRVSV